MKVCMLTTTHRPDDARIVREMSTLSRDHTTTLLAVPQPYPKWQHPLKLLELLQKASALKADVYHCHEPDALLIGLMQKLRGKKVVYDVHEHWPSELPRDVHAPAWTGSILDPLERWMSRRADAVIAVSGSVGSRFPGCTLLPNYPSLYTQHPADASPHSLSTIAAKIHSYHSLNECIQVVQNLKESWEDVSLTLIGIVDPSRIPGNLPVICTGYVPQNRVYGYLGRSRIGLVLLKPEYENIRIGLPNKLFNYMACGVPVIASDLPEMSRLIETTDCGLLVEPGDVDGITESALWLGEHPKRAAAMGERGRKAIQDYYNWQAVEGRLSAVYTRMGARA